MTGGQPARGPELLSVRHSNTVQGGHRNIFIEDGMVVFVTRYHKGYKVSGDVKIIHRYLPREVGELVVWYMWLVLPFQQRLEALVWEKEAVSSHMWPADPSGRKWTTDRLREALKRESRIAMGQEWTFARYREIAIGISRRFLRRATAFQADEGEENKEWAEEQAGDSIANEQAGHTSHVAGLVYARGIMEQSGAVADRRQQFRASSTDWHRFLGFQAGVDDQRRSSKRKRAPFESEADEARVDRWQRLRKMDARAQLKRMMGEKAEFRGVQEAAIKAITAGESPVVAVMPTGAGKSLLFMLPAWAEQGGTTVVVVPLIALRGDMAQRCKKLGISCVEWQSRRPPDAAAVVLVTPESAVGEEFATFLNRLRATRQLDRIIIDECHIVLNRQYTFRKQMQQLGKLVAVETQMVMLTATLPPSEEDELFRRMHFERGQVRMFRAPTARSNIAYRVVRVEKERKRQEVEATVLAMVQQKVRKYKSGKIVVYGNSVPKVKGLAEKLKCHAYHHHAVGKASMLGEFMGGKQRVIVATSALGMGVDVPDIRCIVHMDWPFSVLDYAQESGRAGRDGERSEAIMMVQDGEQRAADDKQGEAEQRLVRAYVEGIDEAATCRRVVLDGYLDRREAERARCEEGEERCDEDMEEGGSSNEEEAETLEREQEEARQTFNQQQREQGGPRQRLIQQRQQEFADVEWLLD
ncbi:telomere-linked helicase 1 [Pyrenophora tritici-repentis]|nr:telomere-linked helicase 1 [Pyrenophora tritici-repentis]